MAELVPGHVWRLALLRDLGKWQTSVQSLPFAFAVVFRNFNSYNQRYVTSLMSPRVSGASTREVLRVTVRQL